MEAVGARVAGFTPGDQVYVACEGGSFAEYAAARADKNADDPTVLRELVEAGTVTPLIDRTYPLRQTSAAIRYLNGGHARRQGRHHM